MTDSTTQSAKKKPTAQSVAPKVARVRKPASTPVRTVKAKIAPAQKPLIEVQRDTPMNAPTYADRAYYSARGRRKEAVARIRLYPGKAGPLIVNQKSFDVFFPYFEFSQIVKEPLEATGRLGNTSVTAMVHGGGVRAQAEAVRLAIARALVMYDEAFKKTLRPLGYLTRDSRAKERKKPGLKRARRAPQFAKR